MHHLREGVPVPRDGEDVKTGSRRWWQPPPSVWVSTSWILAS